MTKILIVEDDVDLGDTVQDWLGMHQYVVDKVTDGNDALQLLSAYGYDLIILDIDVPGVDGLEICRRFRAQGGTAQILMLTAKAEITERATGLDAGADDYLTKPFHMQELSARIRALMRRSKQIKGPVLEAGPIVLDTNTHKVTKSGKEIHLQKMEFNLLEFLMRHQGQVFSGDQLLDRVWPADAERSSQTMRALVKKLRDKIDSEGNPSIIQNVHGIGYKLEA